MRESTGRLINFVETLSRFRDIVSNINLKYMFMKARVQYNDYLGTAAADKSDLFSLVDFLKEKGVDVDRYEPIGVDFYSGYSDHISYTFICKDNQNNENKLVKIGFESKCTYEEFFNLFKRFNAIVTWAKGNDYSDYEVDDNTIYIDDRK